MVSMHRPIPHRCLQREQTLKDLGAKLREARSAANTAKPAAATWEGNFAPFLAGLKAFALTRATEPELVCSTQHWHNVFQQQAASADACSISGRL